MSELVAYCARSWWLSTWRTTGTRPLTSPPLTADSLDLNSLRAPLVYLRLHGIPGAPYLFGDDRMPALAIEQVRALDLEGGIVFLEGCWGGRIADAFLQAGAVAVVGAEASTWGRRWLLGPSSLVGREWLRTLNGGATVQEALNVAVNQIEPGRRDKWRAYGDTGARKWKRR